MIETPGCRVAILRQLVRSAENWKLDRPLAEKCMGDVLQLCRGVQPGDGRVHACLRQNEDKLSPECREVRARPTGSARPPCANARARMCVRVRVCIFMCSFKESSTPLTRLQSTEGVLNGCT